MCDPIKPEAPVTTTTEIVDEDDMAIQDCLLVKPKQKSAVPAGSRE
jgi:hypothetical protein